MVTREVGLVKLTKRTIDKFTYAGGWDVRWDDDLPGFGVRIYPSGKKSYMLSYRARGRKRRMVIGNCNAMTLTQARERAAREMVNVRDGRDPIEERRKDAQGKTFDDLAVAFIDRHAKPHKKTWETDQGRLERHIPASWRKMRVTSITREDIAALHADIGMARPYEANRTLDLLRIMFRLAKLWYFVDADWENPAEGIQKYKEQKRKRFVTKAELPALAKAIDTESNVYVRGAIWLYLLSGLRKTELLSAKRDDVDWDRGMLRLPDPKAGEEQQATLSGPALAILQSLPKVAGNPYLLPGARKNRPLVNINKPWSRVRRAAGIEDVRLHDLRRTVGSWMSQAGVDLNRVRDALRHSNLSTTLTYARLGADPVREAMEEHGRRILEAAGRSNPVVVEDRKE